MEKVKLLGHIVDDGENLWLISSAAEVGFKVTGATRVLLKLRADDSVLDPAKEPLLPRFEIRLDGKEILDARLNVKDAAVTVFEGDEKRDAEVRLIKLNEGNSLFALRDILTDGKVETLPEKSLKMEFIGDSITCGYGVEGKSEMETFTTATENAAKGYAFLTAEALDADAVLTCYSGHGIVSGYTGDPSVRNGADLVPPYYEKEGRNEFRLPTGKYAQETERDFSRFQPEYIVLNLGTNDLSWCGTDESRGKQYAELYAEFLKTVRKDNPGARILCTLGVMGTGLNGMMQQAAEAYCRETGDREIRVLLLEEQDAARDGYGSDFHPNEITQRLLAGTVTDALKKWMKQ
jgi:lysophospholipase L1-like esterase